MYRRVEIKDGESIEPVQFVAVHPLRWPAGLVPQAAFVEADGIDAKLAAAEALAEVGLAIGELLPRAIQAAYNDWESDSDLETDLEEVQERLQAALSQYREAK